VKAAEQLKLRVLTVADPAIAELAAKLPAGRIYASGKGLVPNVSAALYTKLLAAAGPGARGSIWSTIISTYCRFALEWKWP
jgi:hypothetical protein